MLLSQAYVYSQSVGIGDTLSTLLCFSCGMLFPHNTEVNSVLIGFHAVAETTIYMCSVIEHILVTQ